MDKKKYKSVYSRMVTLFISFTVIPIIMISIIFFRGYSNTVASIVISNVEQMSYYLSKNIGDIVSDINTSTKSIYLYTAENGDTLGDMIEGSARTVFEKKSEMSQMLLDIIKKNDYVDAVHFIDRYGNDYHEYRSRTETLLSRNKAYERFEMSEWSPMHQMVILPTVMQSNDALYKKGYQFTAARNYMDMTSMGSVVNEILGKIYIDVSIDHIERLTADIDIGKNGQIVLWDMESQSYIYDTHDRNYNNCEDLDEHLAAHLDEADGGGLYKSSDSYIVYRRIQDSPWILIMELRINDIMHIYLSNALYLLLLILCTGTVMIIFGVYYSNKISWPVKRLTEAMDAVEKGNLETSVDIKSNDELEVLAEGFNKMSDNLNKYIERVYVAELKQSQAELDALKSQINPHYLYNTLDVIRMSAITHEDEETAKMLGSLSRQLRYLTDGAQDQVTLKEELDNVRDYFELMKIRYQNKIQLQILVRDADKEIKILKLLLQPVVENCIKHGFSGRESGNIRISAQRERMDFIIQVMDDGTGIAPAQLALVRERIGKEGAHDNIGLQNIFRRIRKKYGSPYGIEIESMEKIGTVVTLKIPLKEKEESDV